MLSRHSISVQTTNILNKPKRQKQPIIFGVTNQYIRKKMTNIFWRVTHCCWFILAAQQQQITLLYNMTLPKIMCPNQLCKRWDDINMLGFEVNLTELRKTCEILKKKLHFIVSTKSLYQWFGQIYCDSKHALNRSELSRDIFVVWWTVMHKATSQHSC